uniref:Innexin n=1 Tax=Magallana gigas TaxID=29159 RepID=K1Q8X2_MAGGI
MSSAESWVDGLNGRWTPLLFLVLGVFSLIGQLYVGPIVCTFPSGFTESDVKYGTYRCFTATNLAVPHFEPMFKVPLVGSKIKEQDYGGRTLHQYVPLILIMQAIFLRFPYILWKLGEKKLGLLDPFLKKENQTSFGSQVLGNIRENDARFFKTSPAFPREIMCDYEIRYLSNVQRYTVQCVLPFNPYLEQIMSVVWWWLIFLVAATVADGLIYSFGAVLPCFRVCLNQTLTEQNISRFSNNKLGEDVIVFLKHIQDQENGCVVMETVTELEMVSHGGSVQSFPVNVYSPPQPGGTIEVSNTSAPPYGQLGDNQGVPRKNEGQGRHHASNLYLSYSSST